MRLKSHSAPPGCGGRQAVAADGSAAPCRFPNATYISPSRIVLWSSWQGRRDDSHARGGERAFDGP